MINRPPKLPRSAWDRSAGKLRFPSGGRNGIWLWELPYSTVVAVFVAFPTGIGPQASPWLALPRGAGSRPRGLWRLLRWYWRAWRPSPAIPVSSNRNVPNLLRRRLTVFRRPACRPAAARLAADPNRASIWANSKGAPLAHCRGHGPYGRPWTSRIPTRARPTSMQAICGPCSTTSF